MTSLKKIGEFGLIRAITRKTRNKSIKVGIGDDAAVIKVGGKLLAVTTDSVVENIHFSFRHFTPEQIGKKAVEINVSDIAAMGGTPKYALVSLILKENTAVEKIKRVYNGIYQAAKKYSIEIIGGNTAKGNQTVIDITLIGEVERENLCRRSDARPGDFIFVSGDLGKSAAALELLRRKMKMPPSLKKAHLEPVAQLKKAKQIAPFANAMEDISDGLASEIRHICEQSSTGAVIFTDNLPIKEEARKAAGRIGKKPEGLALYGGEEFELVYTIPEKNLNRAKGYLIGEITRKKGVRTYSKGKEKPLKNFGFDHFRKA